MADLIGAEFVGGPKDGGMCPVPSTLTEYVIYNREYDPFNMTGEEVTPMTTVPVQRGTYLRQAFKENGHGSSLFHWQGWK